ncbi:lipid-A-disaccharide synthase N-terminal domain-containing protein [Frateuria aurantia]
MLPNPQTLPQVVASAHHFQFTMWKVIGFCGALMFTSRWVVQMYYTRRLKRVVMPVAFWWLSVLGSALQLAYFIFGKNDSVGIIANFFPTFVAVYNLMIELKRKRRLRQGLLEEDL